MKKFILIILSLLSVIPSYATEQKPNVKQVDICVYGGTSLGVIAAYTAKKQGKSVLLIEPTTHIGGMSSGGLGQTDIGNKYVVQGLSLDFYRRLGSHYGTLEKWIFEPHVAEDIFRQYIAEEELEVWYNRRIIAASKEGSRITDITLEDSVAPDNSTNCIVEAKVFIDCTYEGDLMARAGVSYIVGREDNSVYGETLNGFQIEKKHQFTVDVDPYVKPGKKKSGLLYGISPSEKVTPGTGDNKVQAYNFRICLTDKKDNMVPITMPDNYDPSKYELLIRLKEKQPWKKLTDIFIWSRMPNQKTDINNRGAFSTDMIGANYDYPEASYEERARIIKEHEDYTKGLLYFVGHDERIPENIRKQMLKYGYPKDEYVNNNHWTPQIYVREARRMIGDLVMTQHHCQGRETVTDGIAYAAYNIDSHNCDRLVVDGYVRNEGDVQKKVSPFPISYRSIVPKRAEVTNLFVTFCLSASHVAFGSIRMEPVCMLLSQVAATAASIAIDQHNCVVQDVDVASLNATLKSRPWGDDRKPDIVVDNSDKNNVRLIGKWHFDKSPRSYGYSRRYDDSLGESYKAAQFYPNINEDGEYHIYYYYPKQAKPSSNIYFNIFDGDKIHEVKLSTKEIKIVGQTSGEWVYLGTYSFIQGAAPYVEITNRDADGTIVADAVQFIPKNR